MPLSVLDRLRDLLDAGARKAPARVSTGLRTASLGLTRAAHAVEHLPVMRRGEDPSTRNDRAA